MNETSAPSDIGPANQHAGSPPMTRFGEGDTTFEGFLDIIPDGQKADLLNGVIYVAFPEDAYANKLLVWLSGILSNYAEMKDLGVVYAEKVAFRLGQKHGPAPDLSFVPKDLEPPGRPGYIDVAPALAIEIVTPDSAHRDYVLKRAIYEQGGVREYWILDPGESRSTFLVLRKGRYEEVQPIEHIFSSEVLPGLRLDVRWFWASERPRGYEVVQQLLRGS